MFYDPVFADQCQFCVSGSSYMIVDHLTLVAKQFDKIYLNVLTLYTSMILTLCLLQSLIRMLLLQATIGIDFLSKTMYLEDRTVSTLFLLLMLLFSFLYILVSMISLSMYLL